MGGCRRLLVPERGPGALSGTLIWGVMVGQCAPMDPASALGKGSTYQPSLWAAVALIYVAQTTGFDLLCICA